MQLKLVIVIPGAFCYPCRIRGSGIMNKTQKNRNALFAELTELRSRVKELEGAACKCAEEQSALRESGARFHGIYSDSPIGIEIYDSEGRLLDINRACAEIFGVSEVSDVMGFRLFEDPNLPADMKERLRRGETVRHEFPFDFEKVKEYGLYRTAKSGIIYLDVIIAPFGAGGNGTGYLVQVQDITERKRMQEEKDRLREQLQQVQKMESLGLLAGGIAHDFNNRLVAITNYGYLLKMKMAEDDPLREYVERMLSSAARAAGLTKDLLLFGRKATPSAIAVRLNELIRGIIGLLPRIVGENIELSVNLSDDDPVVMAEPDRLENVILNLSVNARDAMPEGGRLEIKTELFEMDADFVTSRGFGSPGRYALLSVSDAGTGMDNETVKRIFEPFFTTKKAGKGTGLGLSIVYSIIRQYDGFIDVESSPGAGTTFGIYLPVVVSRAAERPEAEAPLPLSGKETVLLVEDDSEVREVTADLLRKFGYNVLEASAGGEALRMFDDNKDNISVLLLDIVMPGMDGREVYEEARKIRSDIKAVFMSGYAAESAKGGEGVSVLSKPVPPDVLLRKIRAAIEG